MKKTKKPSRASRRAAPPCSALLCKSCKHMDWTRMYCLFLQHPIENGFAMHCHAMSCGGYMPNATVSGAAEPRTLDGPVGDREYCLICRREIMTESGHVCSSCANNSVRVDE